MAGFCNGLETQEEITGRNDGAGLSVATGE